MRVRISYSVDLEDVPSESTRMLNEALGQLQDALGNVRGLIQIVESDQPDRKELNSKIDNSRKILGAVDARLSDVSMILTGFYDAKEQMVASQQEEDGEPADVLASLSHEDVSIDPKEVEKYVK